MNWKNAIMILATAMLGLSSCDDSYYSPIPEFPVYIEVNTTAAPYNTFIYSQYKYLLFARGAGINSSYSFEPVRETDRTGYGGIILCSAYDGALYAFDMACPYEASSTIRVYPPSKKENYIGQVQCEKCKSVFELGYGMGNPSSGPARKPLRRYKVYTNTYTLTVIR